MSDFIHLSNRKTSLILQKINNNIPSIVYYGEKIKNIVNNNNLSLALNRPVPQAFLDEDVTLSLLPEEGQGFLSSPGLKGECSRNSWTTQFEVTNISSDSSSCKITCRDKKAGLELVITIKIVNDVVQLQHKITNNNKSVYNLHELNLTVPMPRNTEELLTFHGRWIQEFKTKRISWPDGIYARENRRGRTSPDNIPYLIAGNKGFAEETGNVFGFHLGWSGNTKYKAVTMTDGNKFVQFSELLLPGEISLTENESYETPTLYLSFSNAGLNGLSENFHNFLRKDNNLIKRKRQNQPVHFNTWEAIYFDHKEEKLYELVDKAAEAGVERFIIDDGWFPGRDGEKAGLGDWFVDKNKYPKGLKPIIDYVESKEMEFGLWFEPEMVNPDSELYRNHPDWILRVADYKQRLGRYQYVLNLSNSDAFNYIFERIDALLSEYNIKYIKWDMNRDLTQPGDNNDYPSVHNQVKNLYRLLQMLEDKHPEVSIESCSSGGARIDFAILKNTNRVWTSDCNDALERQKIQKGFSYFLPPEIMGSHFGPSPAHTTNRKASLSFRFLTCFFGHLGFEQDVSTLTDKERIQLQYYVQLHKKYRSLLHSGKYFRIDVCDQNLNAYGVVSNDADQAVICFAQLTMPEYMLPERVHIPYLLPNKNYEINFIDKPLISGNLMKKEPDWVDKKIILSGEELKKFGLQLPIMDPESIILLEFKLV